MRPLVVCTAGASAAARAAQLGLVVVVVDVIDMSTTLESALEEGAQAVFGASPDAAAPPVPVDPAGVGRRVGELALRLGTGVLVVSEPRQGTETELRQGISRLLGGLSASGAAVEAILPNLGRETVRLAAFAGRVVVAATASGGVAFDAALLAGGAVTVGTVARTAHAAGLEPARRSARRALVLAAGAPGVAVVAASRRAWEDVLGARTIAARVRAEWEDWQA